MIRVMRTIRIARGVPVNDVVSYAKEIVDYINKIDGVPEYSVYLNSLGKLGTLRWFADYEDLATYERVTLKLSVDQGYLDLAMKGQNFAIEGSAHVEVMRLM